MTNSSPKYADSVTTGSDTAAMTTVVLKLADLFNTTIIKERTGLTDLVEFEYLWVEQLPVIVAAQDLQLMPSVKAGIDCTALAVAYTLKFKGKSRLTANEIAGALANGSNRAAMFTMITKAKPASAPAQEEPSIIDTALGYLDSLLALGKRFGISPEDLAADAPPVDDIGDYYGEDLWIEFEQQLNDDAEAQIWDDIWSDIEDPEDDYYENWDYCEYEVDPEYYDPGMIEYSEEDEDYYDYYDYWDSYTWEDSCR